MQHIVDITKCVRKSFTVGGRAWPVATTPKGSILISGINPLPEILNPSLVCCNILGMFNVRGFKYEVEGIRNRKKQVRVMAVIRLGCFEVEASRARLQNKNVMVWLF